MPALPKSCLNMNLVKQFIELGGFDKIEQAPGVHLAKARDDFVNRY